MNALLKLVASPLLLLQIVGCATAPTAVKAVATVGDSIAVVGFVKAPGRYSYHEDMTLAEAIREAGGYGRCSSCQKFYDENGWHPTFDMPPKITRQGRILQLPRTKGEWLQFTLKQDDEVKFRHIPF